MVTLALSSWSLHSEFLNADISGLTAAKFPQLARRQFGVKHIEFYEGDYAGNFLDPAFNERYAHHLRECCEREKVQVVCIAAVNDLAQDDDPKKLEIDRRRLMKWADHARILGCRVIRVNTGRKRLDRARLPHFVEELRRLADELQDYPVRLAVENHPHSLRSDEDTDLLLDLFARVGSPNVRACPDLGAMGPDYWKEGLRRLARYAIHVHLKPMVPVTGSDGQVGQLGLEKYGPEARAILEQACYEGAVSLEYMPFRDGQGDVYEATQKLVAAAARVFDVHSLLARDPAKSPSRSDRQTVQVSKDTELTPARGILQLLADGCERGLHAQVHIHDFATSTDVASQSAAHRLDGNLGGIQGAAFCGLADRDAHASQECKKFYQQTLDQIRSGKHDRRRLCICPMGLMTLSVPIKDGTNLYGAIVGGPWVEEGTEGLIVDSLLHHVEPGRRETMEEASLQINAYSSSKLQESDQLLTSLAKDLAGLYEERYQAKRYLLQGTQIINELRQRSSSATPAALEPEAFVDVLKDIFKEFQGKIGFGQLALYQSQPELAPAATFRTTRELILRVQAGNQPWLPQSVRITATPGSSVTQRARRELADRLRNMTNLNCLSPDRQESNEIVVFCYPRHKDPPSSLRNLIDQFATEVEYILSNLRNLTEVSDARRSLEVFIDRFKHALASPLQGISDRTHQFRTLLEKPKITFDQLRTLASDLQQFSTESGSVLNRFTGRVRITGRGSLRPQLFFALVDPEHLIEESLRKWTRAAQNRQIRLQRIGPSTEPHLKADPSALAEVFGNLVENAVKFANDGTSITVTSQDSLSLPARPELTSEGPIKVVGDSSSHWVITSQVASSNLVPPWRLAVPGRRFIIEDIGLGIAERDAPRIFDLYVQGQVNPEGRVIKGTGLGLAICRDLVEAHGGQITMTSKPLPASEQKPEPKRLLEAVVTVYVDLPYEVSVQKQQEAEGGT